MQESSQNGAIKLNADKEAFKNPFIHNDKFRIASFVVLFSYTIFFLLFIPYRPAFVFYTYPVIYLALVVWRAYSYAKDDNILFILSPCYFVNYFLIIWLIFFNYNKEVELVLFGLVFGPIYVANFVFRSTLGFESPDKYLTCIIHMAPTVIVFCTRWYPGLCSKYWFTFRDPQFQFEWLKFYPIPSVFYIYIIPLICMCSHTVLYNLIFHICLDLNKRQMDLTRYMINHNEVMMKLKSYFNNSQMVIIYVATSCLYTAVVLTLALVAYCSYVFNLLLLLIICGWAVWHTSLYYVKHMSSRPQDTRTVTIKNESEIPCEDKETNVVLTQQNLKEDLNRSRDSIS